MMQRASLALALVLAGCTGQNVDETFVSTHGALLARVECLCPSPACGTTFSYSALMFLDGSVLAHGRAGSASNLAFHERSEADRDEAQVALNPEESACGAPGGEFFAIESGSLNFYTCQISGHVLDETLDVGTDCSGFNKGLFD